MVWEGDQEDLEEHNSNFDDETADETSPSNLKDDSSLDKDENSDFDSSQQSGEAYFVPR